MNTKKYVIGSMQILRGAPGGTAFRISLIWVRGRAARLPRGAEHYQPLLGGISQAPGGKSFRGGIDASMPIALYKCVDMSTGVSAITVRQEGREVTFEYLASVEELKKSGQLTRWVNDHDILLYENEGEIKALSNICRHFGGPVGYHHHKDGVFTCLWHNWRFSCKDGSCLSHPGLPLRQYALKIVDGKIYVDLLG